MEEKTEGQILSNATDNNRSDRESGHCCPLCGGLLTYYLGEDWIYDHKRADPYYLCPSCDKMFEPEEIE